jgi:hypothetical protein
MSQVESSNFLGYKIGEHSWRTVLKFFLAGAIFIIENDKSPFLMIEAKDFKRLLPKGRA